MKLGHASDRESTKKERNRNIKQVPGGQAGFSELCEENWKEGLGRQVA